MQNRTYLSLLAVTLCFLGYTTYYAFTKQPATPVVAVATTTPGIIEDIPAKNILTTKTGKIIKIKETNPSGESLSSIEIIPEGFEINDAIKLETNKLMDFYLSDLNNDGFDELALISVSQGSGSYGELMLFSTLNDTKLIKIETPSITEDTTKKGQIFEGYMGHDIFKVTEGVLTREFPTYTASDTNGMPSGPVKRLYYSLEMKDGILTLSLSSELTPKTASTSTPLYISPLEGTSWIWVSTRNKGTTLQAPSGSKFVLTFIKGDKFGSTTDCNGIGGNYKSGPSQVLSFEDMVSTQMFCEGSKESEYASALAKTTSYTLSTSTLTLVLGKNEGVMTYVKK